ncbi:sodium:solute symporter family transporter [Paludibaculum fermentans]|uniref:sodium:solute symporter family transporter n=1 Tax=Paludibaculum fermentans TaxID=1473598 RepID=UPI003EB9D4FA
MNLSVGGLDLAVILVYLAGVVAIGCYAGFVRRRGGGEGSHYFLAGNTLTWPVIGLAMFAANISTVHLVSLAEAAYKYGLVFGHFEWMAGFTLILLSLFFAPLYLRSRVPTLPDFLERRFNRQCRDLLAVVSLFSAIVIHIGIALYTAAFVLRGILGLHPGATLFGLDALMFFIIALGVLTGIYTMLGGLLAVVWTESIQTVLLLLGAVVITVVAWNRLGGWEVLVATLAAQAHPLAGTAKDIPATTSNFLHMARDASDLSGLPWYSVILGYPVLGIWYWCADQTIVQRVLAARDEKQARLGPLFCAFLKILPVFFFVLPGTICVALVQNNAFQGEGPATAADTYTFMITHLLPVGLKGLVTAAMLAAAMQTCSAALNSTATLFAYDIYKRWRPETTDHKLVVIGKITTVVATVLAIVWSPLLSHYNTIYDGLVRLVSYVSPPITAVFLIGVFWRKASAKGAYITMTSGAVFGAGMFVLDFTGHGVKDFMLTAFGMFLVCSVVLVAASKAFPEALKAEAEPLVWSRWNESFEGNAGGRGLADYRVLSAVVALTFVVLYALVW